MPCGNIDEDDGDDDDRPTALAAKQPRGSRGGMLSNVVLT